MRTFTIVNGPNHGKKLDSDQEDGVTLHVRAAPQLKKFPADADIRFAHPSYDHKYLLNGRYAYYLGEDIITLQL